MSHDEGVSGIQPNSVKQQLVQRGANLACSACGTEMEVQEEFADVLWSPRIDASLLEEDSVRKIAALALVCPRCGYLRFHELAALGLIPPTR